MANPLIFITFAFMASPCEVAPTDIDAFAAAPTMFADFQHEDKKLGFKITTPKKWTQIPIQNDEQWIVGRFQSDKSNHYTDKTMGYTYDHKPELTLIAFSGESIETDLDLGGSKEKEEGSTVSGKVLFENPYKDYEEYLKKTYSGGGWFIDEEKEDDVRGVKVTIYEIKVEKSSRGGPKHILTWVYHLGHADVAVQFECFESAYSKLKKEFVARLKSFKVIERTEERNASSAGFREIFNDADTPEKRKELRITIEKEQHEKALDNLPEDWTADDHKEFLVVSHVNKKHTKKVVTQVGLMLKWLDKQFAYIGPEEYVRRPIVRICANTDELIIFSDSSSWSFTNIEILTCHDVNGYGDMLSGATNEQAFTFWFDERDRELYNRIPFWLKYGLDRVLNTASVKGPRLEFEADQWEVSGIRDAIRDEQITLPSAMLRMSVDDMADNEYLYREFGALSRYLLVGKGAKDKLTKGLVKEYLMHLRDILDEEALTDDFSDGMEDGDEPETEEEEDAAFKARQGVWKENADAIAKEVFDRTFEDWSQDDWDALDKAYLKAIK